MRTIYRESVPVDGEWHTITLHQQGGVGGILHVGCRQEGAVEFWHMVRSGGVATEYEFLVVGTGHPIPDGATYVGTMVTPNGVFVWHLLRRPVTS